MQTLALPVLLMFALVGQVMAEDPQVIEVTLDSYTISPDPIVVTVNQPVTLKVTNKATLIPHNLIINAPEAGIDVNIDLRAGKSGEVTFTPTLSGNYEMECSKDPPVFKSHKEKGMHGVLIVE